MRKKIALMGIAFSDPGFLKPVLRWVFGCESEVVILPCEETCRRQLVCAPAGEIELYSIGTPTIRTADAYGELLSDCDLAIYIYLGAQDERWRETQDDAGVFHEALGGAGAPTVLYVRNLCPGQDPFDVRGVLGWRLRRIEELPGFEASRLHHVADVMIPPKHFGELGMDSVLARIDECCELNGFLLAGYVDWLQRAAERGSIPWYRRLLRRGKS